MFLLRQSTSERERERERERTSESESERQRQRQDTPWQTEDTYNVLFRELGTRHDPYMRACLNAGVEFMVNFEFSVLVHTQTLTGRARADPPGP